MPTGSEQGRGARKRCREEGQGQQAKGQLTLATTAASFVAGCGRRCCPIFQCSLHFVCRNALKQLPKECEGERQSRRERESGRGTALQLLTLPAFMISPPKLGKVKGRRPGQLHLLSAAIIL